MGVEVIGRYRLGMFLVDRSEVTMKEKCNSVLGLEPKPSFWCRFGIHSDVVFGRHFCGCCISRWICIRCLREKVVERSRRCVIEGATIYR